MRMCSGCARGDIQIVLKRFTKQTEFAKLPSIGGTWSWRAVNMDLTGMATVH